MTDLQTQAREYAKHIIAHFVGMNRITTYDVAETVVNAYIQGWVDRDTRDMKPETQDEFFNGE